jgi:phosphoribosyl 1,2-cyclic phosphodiesterase
MLIKCWGTRGSIPVDGKEFLKYGGATTSFEVVTKSDKHIVIDAGSGIRKLGQKLIANKICHHYILFTHAHWDHIIGFPFFAPIYNEKCDIQIFGCPFLQESVEQLVSNSMLHPNFPVKFSDLKAKFGYHNICNDDFTIGSCRIEIIQLNHPNHGLGYKFTEDGKQFVFLTDNELDFIHISNFAKDNYIKFCQGADLLLHDAQYSDEEYKHFKSYGHSKYSSAIELAMDAGVKSLGFIHHDPERTDEQLDIIMVELKEKWGDRFKDLFAVWEGMEMGL